MEDEATLLAAWMQQHFGELLGDADCESERFRTMCCDDLGIRSVLPTTERRRQAPTGVFCTERKTSPICNSRAGQRR